MFVLFDLTIFLPGNASCYHLWELIWDENIHSAINGLHNINTNLLLFLKAGSSWVYVVVVVWVRQRAGCDYGCAPPPPPPHSACHMHRAICPPPHTHIHYHHTFHIPTQHIQSISATYPKHMYHISITEPTYYPSRDTMTRQMLYHRQRGTGYLLESCHNFVHSTKHFWVGTLERYRKVGAHL